MNQIVRPDNSIAMPVTQARCSMNVRAAVAGDLPFIDALQKMHTHMVGFFPRGQIEKNIADGHVLIAEEVQTLRRAPGGAEEGFGVSEPGTPALSASQRLRVEPIPVGYVIAKDQYMKREEVGIVYQLNVMPLRHRHLVGASLVKACFERAAYGCKLFCCWCAQDIQANWFWESIGFIPLAFRTGSRAKQRIHIFWQRRVRESDEVTPYWFPSQTQAGAVGEDRIVLPIPPGTHWRDAKPTVLPGLPVLEQGSGVRDQGLEKLLPGGAPVKARPEKPRLTRSQAAAVARSSSAHLGGAPIGKKAVIRGGRVRYEAIPGFDPNVDGPDELLPPPKEKKERKPRQKNDPKYVAAARELRDRYLEQVNTTMLLPPGACGKYDVSRQTDGGAVPGALRIEPAKDVRLLDAA